METGDILKNIVKFSVPTVVSAIVAVIVLPLISRVYPEAEYGYISNFYSVGTMMMGVVFLGLDSAYIRFFNEPPAGTDRNGMFRFVMSAGLSVTVLFFLIVMITAPDFFSGLLFNDRGHSGLVLLGVFTSGLVICRMFNINFRFFGDIRAFNCQQITLIIGNRLLFVLAAFFSTGYIYSAAIMVICTLVIAAASIAYQPSAFKKGAISREAKITMIRFALPVMPASIIVLLNNSIAKLILGGFGLRDEVGVIAIATSAANVFSVIPNAFSVYWGPFMYKYYDTEQKKIRTVHDGIMLLSIMLVIGVIIVQDVLYVYLGQGYRSSQPYFLIIMLTPVTMLLTETTGYGINIAKKTQYVLFTSVLGCASNIIACLFLIPRIGAYGAAFGVGVSATVTFVLKTIIGQRYYSSISSGIRTFGGCAVIWGLCIGNLVFSTNIPARVIACLAAVCFSLLFYRRTVKSAGRYIAGFFRRGV